MTTKKKYINSNTIHFKDFLQFKSQQYNLKKGDSLI